MSMETGIAPSVLWRESPQDLTTLAAVLIERGERIRRGR